MLNICTYIIGWVIPIQFNWIILRICRCVHKSSHIIYCIYNLIYRQRQSWIVGSQLKFLKCYKYFVNPLWPHYPHKVFGQNARIEMHTVQFITLLEFDYVTPRPFTPLGLSTFVVDYPNEVLRIYFYLKHEIITNSYIKCLFNTFSMLVL